MIIDHTNQSEKPLSLSLYHHWAHHVLLGETLLFIWSPQEVLIQIPNQTELKFAGQIFQNQQATHTHVHVWI